MCGSGSAARTGVGLALSFAAASLAARATSAGVGELSRGLASRSISSDESGAAGRPSRAGTSVHAERKLWCSAACSAAPAPPTGPSSYRMAASTPSE